MRRQIPLHVPQELSSEWRAYVPLFNIPTEEQLTRKPDTDDEFYDQYVRIGIDTTALVSAAMHAFSTTQIPELTYACGGSFNHIFCLRFPDSNFKIAARLPRRKTSSPSLVESTVAMMTMARCYKGIPSPEVYAWHAGNDNPVGTPYVLLQWIESIEAWRKWYDMAWSKRRKLLNDLASHHANFAKPLPYHCQGIGSIYFNNNLPPYLEIDFKDPSTYRIGPLVHGPVYMINRGIPEWPGSIFPPTSLRTFWLEMIQHEVDSVIKLLGQDDSTVIPDSILREEPITIGQFHEIADALRVLVQLCPLPQQSDTDIYAVSFGHTDYAFRNILIDPENHNITAFLDWDDVYVTPFLLCSRYPEEICCWDGSGERWYETGGFKFLPIDEGGTVEEGWSTVQTVPDIEIEVIDQNGKKDSDEAEESDANSEAGSDMTSEPVQSSSEAALTDDDQERVSPSPEPEHDREKYDYPRRIEDTQFRREYEVLLASHDSRFGKCFPLSKLDFGPYPQPHLRTDTEKTFWEMREEPLKIHHLIMNGWVEWLMKDEWIKKRAVEIKNERTHGELLN